MPINIASYSIPFLFIILYGSGFVGTKYALMNSSPFLFLIIRFSIACLILLLIAYLLKASWPKTLKESFHIAVSGSLTVAIFTIGIFMSILYDVSPALSALIIALQPILVSMLAKYFLHEKTTPMQWLGLVVSLFGVALVVYDKIDTNFEGIFGVSMSIMALLALSFGNLYQKKHCSHMNLFTGGAIQTFTTVILVLPFLYFEEMHLTINEDFVYAVFHMSILISIGALSLLYVLIKNKDVSKVASLFYLMPVVAAIMAYVFFDEKLDFMMIMGITLVVSGLFVVNKK